MGRQFSVKPRLADSAKIRKSMRSFWGERFIGSENDGILIKIWKKAKGGVLRMLVYSSIISYL
jgi:hypothetical protein